MKILFIDRIHHKNKNAMLNYKNIDLTIIHNVNEIHKYNLDEYECVYSPSDAINIDLYPNTKFIFGPHFSVFPEQNINMIKNKNTIYIQPSEWVYKFWKNNQYTGNNYTNNLNMVILPFGVDTEKFKDIKDIKERDKVFIYFKNRHPQDLEFVKKFLNNKNINYKIFSYGSYSEEEYLKYLKESKYGIWIGGHESQGFALEEVLSCNVPLLVWNTKYMSQEYGSKYSDIPCTTIPYWDKRCGEYFYDINDITSKYEIFIENLQNYNPREYILDNLTFEKCESKLINIITEIK